ncbi:MAG: glycosyltransferase family 2 protein [Syntrophobacteraceae bacterium]|nr:glycosyltransferase family 2 protein [Syntrophobacteraceae bacterium]
MKAMRYSIVITCYNQREFIVDAVESALSQRHSCREIIVVDDGSKDGSTDILRSYENSIRLLELPANRGAIEARNRGAALAGGEYLVFVDGDDLFVPWTLEVYEQLVMQRRPAVIVSTARYFEGRVPVFTPRDAPERVEFIEYESLMAKDRSHGWYTCALVISRKAFEDAGGWTPGLFHLDDLDLAAKLGYCGKTILICSPFTALYRMHAGNTVHNVSPFLRSALFIIQRERAGLYPGGRQKRMERYAFHGGMVFHWTRRALEAGLYRGGLKLALGGWQMLLTAVLRKATIAIGGRRRMTVRELNREGAALLSLNAEERLGGRSGR